MLTIDQSVFANVGQIDTAKAEIEEIVSYLNWEVSAITRREALNKGRKILGMKWSDLDKWNHMRQVWEVKDLLKAKLEKV